MINPVDASLLLGLPSRCMELGNGPVGFLANSLTSQDPHPSSYMGCLDSMLAYKEYLTPLREIFFGLAAKHMSV